MYSSRLLLALPPEKHSHFQFVGINVTLIPQRNFKAASDCILVCITFRLRNQNQALNIYVQINLDVVRLF